MRAPAGWPSRSPLLALVLLLGVPAHLPWPAFVLTVPTTVLVLVVLSRCRAEAAESARLPALLASAAVWLGALVSIGLLGGSSLDDLPTLAIAAPAAALLVAVGLFQRHGSPWPLALAAVWLHVTGLVGFRPAIDVRYFLEESFHAFVRGHNPYAVRFLNHYGAGQTELFYAPEVVRGEHLDFGFWYLPGVLFADLPGYLLGDVRLVSLVAVLATAVVMWRLATERVGRLLVAGFLVSPMTFDVVQSYWVEPVLVLALALLVGAAVRERRGWAAAALAFFLTLKQYVIVLLPLEALLRRRIGVRAMLVGAAGAAALIIPFVLWSPEAFVRSAVRLQFLQPFRADSTSLLVDVANTWGRPPDWVFSFGTLGAAVVVALGVRLRAPSSITWLAIGTGLSMTALMLMSKQAFVNYYFFPYAALALGAVIWPAELRAAADQAVRRAMNADSGPGSSAGRSPQS